MHSVLFVCVRNSARSQMAEAWLRKLGGDRFEVESAGIEPGTIDPFVVEAMREVGIDLAGKGSQDVFDLYRAGRTFDFVVAVCSAQAAERCPIFPGSGVRLHWPFDDPVAVEGGADAKLAACREVRDQIRSRVEAFLEVV